MTLRRATIPPLSLLLIGLTGFTAGCGGPDPKPKQPAPHTTAAKQSPAARPTAGPPVALGQSVTLIDTVRTTVYDYRQPSVTAGPSAGPAGYTWGSADVQVCTLPAAKQNVTIDWKTWSLHYADNSIAAAAESNNDNFPRPEYPFTSRSLPAGTCARGWITFSVPVAGRPASVDYTPHGAVASWIVPAAAPSAS